MRIDRDVDFGFGTNGTIIEMEAPCIIAGSSRIVCDFIGAYTSINEHVTILHTASIGRFCSIAANVYIGLAVHPTDAVSSSDSFYFKEKWNFSGVDYDYKAQFDLRKEKITIGNDVWIGAGAKIMRGIHIGDGAVIGAGAVVTKDVPPYAVFWGENRSHCQI